ncbi:uncharacterized protein [Fopius arisanus]|uniref:Coiled-coil domain-containing protein 167 n=1 Tax=Fopius arisanus TaxID=64838 RepID=A0A9R1TSV3_9HYME|nr:PREDICTED: uncharacterized protein LOC105274000 [Fopius arisanus]
MNGISASTETQQKQKRCTIMAEIQQVEDSLKDSLHRVQVIERKLETRLLTSESRERLERELELVKEVLKKNQEQLLYLRKQNTKSFMVAAAIAFACFLVYGLYLLVTNTR